MPSSINKLKTREKRCFAALPARALADPNLERRHLRILGWIALHDRFGANNQGCWASNKRLAELAGCNYSVLSSTIGDLDRWGYVRRKPNPRDRRQNIINVMYEEQDFQVFKSDNSDKEAALPKGKLACAKPDSKLCPSQNDPTRYFASRNETHQCYQQDDSGNIFREADEYIPHKRNNITDEITGLARQANGKPKALSSDIRHRGEVEAKLAQRLGDNGWMILQNLTELELQRLLEQEVAGILDVEEVKSLYPDTSEILQ